MPLIQFRLKNVVVVVVVVGVGATLDLAVVVRPVKAGVRPVYTYRVWGRSVNVQTDTASPEPVGIPAGVTCLPTTIGPTCTIRIDDIQCIGV